MQYISLFQSGKTNENYLPGVALLLCRMLGSYSTNMFGHIKGSINLVLMVLWDLLLCDAYTPVCLIIIPVCLFILDKSAGEYSYYFDHKFVSN